MIQLDNAGENKLLQKRSDSTDWKLGIEYEFTARATPQQNSLAEVGIATLANRVRAMMHHAHVPMEYRYKLFRDCYETAAILVGTMASRFEHFSGKNPKCAGYLRTWGEAGTVKIYEKMSPKIQDCGVSCMMIKYSKDHAGDCYWMWGKETGGIHVTRDIIWLKQMYFPAKDPGHEDVCKINDDLNLNIPPAPNVSAEEREVTRGTENNAETAETVDEATNMETTITRSGRVVRAPTRLIKVTGLSGNYEIKLTTQQ